MAGKRGSRGAGRRRNIGPKLDPIEVQAAIMTLQQYAEQERLSYEAISNAIYEWYIDDPDNTERFQPFKVEELDFDIDDNTIGRIISKDHVPNNQKIKAILLWILSIPSCNNSYNENKSEGLLKSQEGEVLSVRRLFGYISGLREVKQSPWVGEYALYRPFHLDPKHQAQVNLLKIGSEKSEFDCELTSKFDGIAGQEQTNTGSGKFTPLDKDHAVALMTMNQGYNSAGWAHEGTQAGSYTLHLSDPWRTPGIVGFRGILVASEGANPSAWPIYAMRVPEGQSIEPHVLSREEYKALPVIVRQQLDRGGVYWNESDFPKALSRGYT